MTSPYRRRLAALLSSPFFLAAIPSLIIFFALPLKHGRYSLELLSRTQGYEHYYSHYDDLNNDGNSEKIVAFDNENSTGVTISEESRIINQWNINGTFSFSKKAILFIPADCNGDGLKEVYLFSIAGDSILLHSIPDPEKTEAGIRDRLITRTGPGIRNPDPLIIPAEADDLDGDGFKELIFGVTSGFSKYPRKVYAYYVLRDSLVSSPDYGGFILGILQEDINFDGVREIIPYGYASGNIGQEEAKYHDQSAWLTVLDRNLDFMFEPREFRGRFALVRPLVSVTENDTVMEALVYVLEKDSTASLVGFNYSGEITGRHVLNADSYNAFMTTGRRGDPVYVLLSRDKGLILFDKNKAFRRLIEYSGSPDFFQVDLDLDGGKEIIIISFEEGRLSVYRPGMRQSAEAEITWDSGSEILFSVRRQLGKAPQLFFQAGRWHYLLEYRTNPLYFIQYGLYPLIYLGFLGFVVLIRHQQQRQLIKRLETEKKMSEMQLALIRNQLDPHFTLNALNSVLYLVEKSEKEKAKESLIRFSGLYRDLLTSAGKARRSLDEEISFCREYLALEKLRFGSRLDYRLVISPEINLELMVPKLIIQLYAENSVKHGLSGLLSGGLLEIRISGEGRALRIEINDNGIGRAGAAGEPRTSTGKGLKVMNELFDLYGKYYGDTVSAGITDLYDSNARPCGTAVRIVIQYRNDDVLIV